MKGLKHLNTVVWTRHVWKYRVTSRGDMSIGNMKTSVTKGMHIALNPISEIASTLLRTAHPVPLEANCLPFPPTWQLSPPSPPPDTQIAATAINLQSTMEATGHCKRWKITLRCFGPSSKLFLASIPRPSQSLSRNVRLSPPFILYGPIKVACAWVFTFIAL